MSGTRPRCESDLRRRQQSDHRVHAVVVLLHQRAALTGNIWLVLRRQRDISRVELVADDAQGRAHELLAQLEMRLLTDEFASHDC